jgi:hypothetical protein
MPSSRALCCLPRTAEAGHDQERYRSARAAVTCALVIGGVVLALMASRSLEVNSAAAEEPVAPILERRMGVAQLNSTLMESQLQAIVAYLRTLTGTLRRRPVGVSP